jgi:sterol desaturase/sphingolipid hydroxylase (fatty acid hydroxylase superfamily)
MSISDQFFEWISITYSPYNFFRLWGSVALLCLLLHIAERVLPAERNQSYRSMVANGRITLVYAILSPVALFGANYLAGHIMATAINRLSGPWFVIDLNNLTNGNSELVRIALLAPLTFAPLLIYDFFYYWFHRLQHANSWLWEQHKLHHSDQALNVTTSYRINWLEDLFKSLLVSIPVAIVLRLQPFEVGIVVSLTGVISHIWGQFLHSNIRLSFSFLSTLLTGPQFHRIHHSIETHHQNKNFTTYFPFWDALFGTYYRPSREEYPRTGVVGELSNPNMREILVGPLLRWGHRLTGLIAQLARKSLTKW